MKNNKQSELIETLKEEGAMLSGELADFYKGNKGAASRAISYNTSIRKMNVKFQDNQRYCYVNEHRIKKDFWNKYVEEIKKNSQAHGAIISALQKQKGYASLNKLQALSISPIMPVSSKRLFNDILQELILDGVVVKIDSNNYLLSENVCGVANSNIGKAIEYACSVVVEDIDRKFRNCGFTSFNKGQPYSQAGCYLWHYTSVSYVRGIAVEYRKNDKSTIVVDVSLNSSYKLEDAQRFLQKLDNASFEKVRLLPFVISDFFEKEAFDLLRTNKVIASTIKDMFSDEYAEAIKLLIESFVNIIDVLKNDPDAIEKIIKQTIKNEGRINNMQGSFFELLCASHFFERGCKYIELGVKVDGIETVSTDPAEIDILLEKDNEMWAIECKGESSRINKERVEKWINKKIPDIKKWAERRYKNKKMNFAYWSLNGFDDDALILLNKGIPTKYSREYLDFEKMKILTGSPKFISILKEHFAPLVKDSAKRQPNKS